MNRTSKLSASSTQKQTLSNAHKSHEAYRPEPPTQTVVDGVRCVNIDGGRLADVAAAYRVWGLK